MKHIFIALLALAVTPGVRSQVTIGIDETPSQGSLLDLKNIPSATLGDANATKGLGLPRVQLTSANDIKQDISGVLPGGEQDHQGLVVYNSNGCFNGIGKGVFVWNGTAWVYLGTPPTDNTAFDSASGILTDYDGNKYTTKVYGGKRWMTQYLRSLRGSDGMFIECPVMLNPALMSTPTGAIKIAGSIPSGTVNFKESKPSEMGASPTSLTNKEYVTRFGLLYNYAQAQNACPRGWHLSTEQDWIDLTNLAGSVLYEEAAIHLSERNNIIMPADSPYGWYWGGYETTDAKNMGFNALPSGFVKGSDQSPQEFASMGLFWFEAPSVGKQIRMSNDPDGSLPYQHLFLEDADDLANYYSVRCVQD